MKTNKQQQQKAKQKTSKQTISKPEKQQTKERKQNTKYTKPEKNNVFPLTRATLIKNEFMTLIFVCVIFEQALQKRMCGL
jgi:hypothetical protein